MNLKNYPGNKSIHGLYQFIINRIPPHTEYYELFAGSATIGEKLPDTAKKTFVDINPEVIKELQTRSGTVNYVCTDALQFITTVIDRSQKQLYPRRSGTVTNTCTGPPRPVQLKTTVRTIQSKVTVPARESGSTVGSNCTFRKFIYADPPYRFINRRGKRNIYEYEMTDPDHIRLLKRLSTVNANCMISHPHNLMYDKYLKGWTKEKTKVSYHGKITDECIYYNYPKPTVLQTYQYVGDDCWDRQGVKRKIDRLTNKLMNLPALERNAVINRVLLQYSQK